jgi:hypothetical protein
MLILTEKNKITFVIITVNADFMSSSQVFTHTVFKKFRLQL